MKMELSVGININYISQFHRGSTPPGVHTNETQTYRLRLPSCPVCLDQTKTILILGYVIIFQYHAVANIRWEFCKRIEQEYTWGS